MPIAFCPHPPLLVPAVAQGAADELAYLRTACDAVVRALVDGRGSDVTVVGSAPASASWDATAGGSLDGFGVGVRAGGASTVLPLSLTVGAWLLDRAGWEGPRTYVAVSGDEIVDVRGSVLVMADGTAKRTEQAPGHIDDRAPTYDKAIAQALASGDADALAALDTALGVQLWSGGVPALRTIGRSVAASSWRVADARLRYDDAPYGVGYFVAEWELG
ncbi:class III extradiol ring-cleavage dioxygenase family protein [Solicola gregarius]|uniref:Uncharacterized protein n=1 Tax=Solicola gregarius TaxID=2908642 RepID=A0AA46YKK5_9ACTN|nr:hypothetical protein [Solicola gregarius]UYM04571.1 hypothetical protein L0C25_18855 [Solicola gregarius]